MIRYSCLTCGKTAIVETEIKEGMMCNCTPPKAMKGRSFVMPRGTVEITPLSDEMLEGLSVSEAAAERTTMCAAWGIKNKSHTSHGANFSSRQARVALIHDIVSVVSAPHEWTRIRGLIARQYGYDIETCRMV